jgi:transposase
VWKPDEELKMKPLESLKYKSVDLGQPFEEVCEYNTSKYCNTCFHRLKLFNPDSYKVTPNKRRQFSKLLFCSNCTLETENCKPKIWHRDENAALNILKNGLHQLAYSHLHPGFFFAGQQDVELDEDEYLESLE